jgi:hypothetical protein
MACTSPFLPMFVPSSGMPELVGGSDAHRGARGTVVTLPSLLLLCLLALACRFSYSARAATNACAVAARDCRLAAAFFSACKSCCPMLP